MFHNPGAGTRYFTKGFDAILLPVRFASDRESRLIVPFRQAFPPINQIVIDRMKRIIPLAEVLIVIVISVIPLFPNLPYRLNSYLSWEGAYRMANGQLPFRD